MSREAAKAMKRELSRWLEDEDTSGVFSLKACDDSKMTLLAEEEHPFDIQFPPDYPKTPSRFVISSSDKRLETFVKKVNEYAQRQSEQQPPVSLKQLLSKASDLYMDLFGEEVDDDDDDDDEAGGGRGGVGIDDDNIDEELFGSGLEEPRAAAKEKPKSNPRLNELERKSVEKKFLDIGSPAATLRILNDLRNIYKQDAQAMGFSVEPVLDKRTGLENLYHWHVRLSGFDKSSLIGKDLAELQKRIGMDHILLEMRFSKDYPHLPPFVRVVKPRFAFRTGHVTIGGSICMELLTRSGWSSINDIESVLVQIRSEMMEGGAQLDRQAFNSPNLEYSEHEAWVRPHLFYARTHAHIHTKLSLSLFTITHPRTRAR
jgi:ubiquitin-conjugating enzyme E2 Q